MGKLKERIEYVTKMLEKLSGGSMRQIVIDGKRINDNSTPYVIAEIGHNHCGSLDICKEMFRVAKTCGADAVKLQKRDNKALFTKQLYNAPYDNENSYGKTYGEHRERLEFGLKEYTELKRYAKELDITFFATAFDENSADFLKNLDFPVYKIASADLKNIPLIAHIARFGKPLIISTGGASWADIDRVYELLLGRADFALLHCVASYPNQPDELNLNVIKAMKERYPHVPIGFSDHFNGIVMSEAAYLLGASIIEKHFTLNHTWKGTDHALSLEPQGLESLCKNLKRLKIAQGISEKIILPSEQAPIRKMGKSIWPIRTIRTGEVITEDKIAIKSPGGGLPPYELENVVGKVSINELSTANPIKEEDFI